MIEARQVQLANLLVPGSWVHNATTPVRKHHRRITYKGLILDLGKREYTELSVGHDGMIIAYASVPSDSSGSKISITCYPPEICSSRE